MPIILYIIIFTFIGSIFSLIGGIALLYNERFTLKTSHFVASFAAGALLGTAFFDLLPEASEEAGETNIFLWALFGILIFFLLERFIHWFHHHQREHHEEKIRATVPLIIFGDSVHNFIDGVVIAVTFLLNIPLGIVTALSVAAHEIPQEIGDFGILLHKGMKRDKVLLVNVLSASVALVGALIAFFLGDSIQNILPILLSLTAGFFIYISASDLIPEIHHHNARGLAAYEIFLLFSGVAAIWVFVSLFD